MDSVIAVYTKIVAGSLRSTVSWVVGGTTYYSSYVETTKQTREDFGIHLGFWRRGMEGYIKWTTWGVSKTANDPGSPQLGETRAFTVNMPATVSGSSPNQYQISLAVNAFAAGTPTTTAVTLTATVSERTENLEWQMGRVLVKTVWRAWVPLAVTTQGGTTFLMKPRQEIGYKLQVRGLETPSTVEWTCRHTNSVETDFRAAYAPGSSMPTNGGSANVQGQVLLGYDIICNTWSGEDEITAHYGLYIGGGGGLIGKGYLLPFSNVRQDFDVAAPDGNLMDTAFVDPGGSGAVYQWTATGDWRIQGWRLDFNISALSFPLTTILTGIKGYKDIGTGPTAGMLCLEAICEPERGGLIRVRVDFVQVLGGTCQKQVGQGGAWVNVSGATGAIALAAPSAVFGTTGAGLYLYIL